MLSTSVERSQTTTPCNSNNGVELDPLLKDLTEKKQIFQRSVLSLASDLKAARTRLAEEKECFSKETQIRKEAEAKTKNMEEKMHQLQRDLEERDWQLNAFNIANQQYLKDLDGLRLEILASHAATDDSAKLAQSAEMQILSLKEDRDNKSNLLKEQEDRINKLEEQLNLLQQDLQGRELSQIQLLDEALRIQKEIMVAVSSSGARECELIEILEEISAKNIDNINKNLNRSDEEITRLTDEIRFLSKKWKHKTKQLQSQLEKHQRTGQELQKRVVKLEFGLQEDRAQPRKLQRMGERRDSSLKELRHQLTTHQQNESSSCNKHNIWESPIFKITASISMLVLVVLARR